jgi:hypothetical protein
MENEKKVEVENTEVLSVEAMESREEAAVSLEADNVTIQINC